LTTAAGWTEVRCRSPRCHVAGGLVLFRRGPAGMYSVERRGLKMLCSGSPVVVECSCGAKWRNPYLTAHAAREDCPTP
jgi:hypothetical protein